MRAVVILRSDGGVSILRRARDGDWDIPAAIAKWLADYQVTAPAVTVQAWAEIDPSTILPADRRRFRNALRFTDRLEMDFGKARAICLDRLRAERARRFAKSDADLLRAQDQGNAALVTTLRTYRQALRDLPVTEGPLLAAITTVQGLDAYEPAWPVDPA